MRFLAKLLTRISIKLNHWANKLEPDPVLNRTFPLSVLAHAPCTTIGPTCDPSHPTDAEKTRDEALKGMAQILLKGIEEVPSPVRAWLDRNKPGWYYNKNTRKVYTAERHHMKALPGETVAQLVTRFAELMGYRAEGPDASWKPCSDACRAPTCPEKALSKQDQEVLDWLNEHAKGWQERREEYQVFPWVASFEGRECRALVSYDARLKLALALGFTWRQLSKPQAPCGTCCYDSEDDCLQPEGDATDPQCPGYLQHKEVPEEPKKAAGLWMQGFGYVLELPDGRQWRRTRKRDLVRKARELGIAFVDET